MLRIPAHDRGGDARPRIGLLDWRVRAEGNECAAYEQAAQRDRVRAALAPAEPDLGNVAAQVNGLDRRGHAQPAEARLVDRIDQLGVLHAAHQRQAVRHRRE